ncbi:MAG: PAS domain S-box protein [Desulfobacula sp.]|nr:PAS domain S-box protein [Desulfobacula sp.]
MQKKIKEPVIQKLIFLLVIICVSFVGLIIINTIAYKIAVGGLGFILCLVIIRQIFFIIWDWEKNQIVLKEQNLKIIRKSIELSDVMRQFEDKNYDLEISRKALNQTLYAVEEKEKDQRIIFKNSPLGIIRLDKKGAIKYCNDKFVDLMGSTKEKLTGFLATRNNTPQMQEAIDKAIDGQVAVFEGQFPSQTQSSPLELRAVFNPVDPGISPTEVIATIEDISMRVKAEMQLKQSHLELENLVKERTEDLLREIEDREAAHEALKKSEEKYRSILENIEDVYFELDLKGKFQFFNNPLLDLLGYTREELLGMNYKSYTNKQDAKNLFEAFSKVFQTGQTSPLINCRFFTKENVQKNVGIISSLMKNKNGEPIGFQGLARDVTKQRMMETRLQQTQKMEAIGNLAGGVAHDFNNILGGIIGYTQLIKKHSQGVSKIQPYVDQIIKASGRATGLVKQILLFSRNTESEKIPSDIVLIAKEVIKLCRASIPTTIEIKHHFKENLSPVLVDQTQIHQVFMNLCSNAAYAMKKNGGCLELELSDTVVKQDNENSADELKFGDYITICVSDTGKGMDRNTMKKIFDPYFTTKQVGEGTGLGLATVHGIIKDHGGAIKVKSKEAIGTQVKIYLPAIQQSVQSDKEPNQVEGGSESILFVDDEIYLAEVGKEMLEDYGYSVAAMTSSKEAFELFEQDPARFDLVITDYTMPEMTGAQLAGKIKKIDSNMPIVMCTGISLDPELVEGACLEKILMKPLDMDTLLVMVRGILDKPLDKP